MPTEILKKIGEIDVPRNPRNPEGLIRLDVARNGMFYLVENAGRDAYGNPKCEILNIIDSGPKDNGANGTILYLDGFCSGLVQVIGSLIVERDSLAAQLASAVRTKE